jgi:hypothetical protein
MLAVYIAGEGKRGATAGVATSLVATILSCVLSS